MYRLCIALAVGTFAAATLLAPWVYAGDAPTDKGASPETLKWDLERLSKEPFKLVKSTPDGPKRQVRFVVEFTRTPLPSEMLDWEHSGGLVVFRFLDEDGVVLSKLKPHLEGELIPKKGARIRLLLSMPDEKTLALTRSVKAE